MNMDTLAVHAELACILQSRCFRSRKILQKLLRYLVKHAITPNNPPITQYAIAVEGLGKPADFNASTDPVIRIQIGRLRKQLEEYYATEGRFNPLRISLPNRSYQAVFTHHKVVMPQQAVVREEPSPSLSQGPSMVCIPRNFLADETFGWPFITRLTRDYVTALTHFSFCQVMFADETPWQNTNAPQEAWLQYGADFALFLDLHTDKRGYNLKCSLVDSLNRQVVWAHSFPLGENYPEQAALNTIFKRIAHDTITYDPGIAHTHWVQQMLDAGKPIASHHQVLVAVRQYIWNPNPITFRVSYQACEQRLEKFPHDTQALFVYANHCFTEYATKYNIIESTDTKLAYTANALLQLAPGNAFSHAYHALSCLIEEDYEQCREALAITQATNPLDTYLNVHLGLMYLALGDWQMGARYIQDSIDVSPVYPDWYHLPLSVCRYREGHYLAAMQEIQHVRFKHLWTPMLRTALYQCNQKLEKSTKEYQRMVHEYPDFIQKSREITRGLPLKINSVLHQLWSNLPDNQR